MFDYLHGYKHLPGNARVIAAARYGFLSIILCALEGNTLTPYVTWIYNHQASGAGSGDYCTTFSEARVSYLKRTAAYLPTVGQVVDMQNLADAEADAAKAEA